MTIVLNKPGSMMNPISRNRAELTKADVALLRRAHEMLEQIAAAAMEHDEDAQHPVTEAAMIAETRLGELLEQINNRTGWTPTYLPFCG